MSKRLVTGGRSAGLIDSPNVLRDVPLHEVPHALPRRGVLPSLAKAVDSDKHSSVAHDVLDVQDQARQRGYALGFETGMREGQSQGHKQGHELGYQQGNEQGYQDGLKQGKEQAHAEQAAARKVQAHFQEGTRRLEDILARVPQQIAARLAEAEDDMVALCFDAVCKIAGKELATAAGVRQHLLHVLRDFNLRVALKVHVHPDDLALLQHEQLPLNGVAENQADSSAIVDGVDAELERMGHNQVQWVPDTNIAMGGCVLRSSEGGLDARLQTQLESLRSVFVEVRNARKLTMRGVDGNVPAPVPRKRAGRRASDNRGQS